MFSVQKSLNFKYFKYFSQEERTKAYVETPTPTPPKGKRRPWRAGLFCPIMDLSIESLVKEPTAESLLMRVGAINEEGELSCELKDFNAVQHKIRKQLILWAIEVQAKEKQDEEGAAETQKLSFNTGEKNVYRHVKKVLDENFNKECIKKEDKGKKSRFVEQLIFLYLKTQNLNYNSYLFYISNCQRTLGKLKVKANSQKGSQKHVSL